MGEPWHKKVIVQYEDVTICNTELDILVNEQHPMNETLMAFYFSYLRTTYASQDIILVTPSVVPWIIQNLPTPEVDYIRQAFHDPKDGLLLFPIKKSNDVEEGNGGHWSLLVFNKMLNLFVHHDDQNEKNKIIAKMICEFFSVASTSSSSSRYDYSVYSLPRENPGDNGFNIAIIAKQICCWYETRAYETDPTWLPFLKKNVITTVSELRSEMLDVIKKCCNNSTACKLE